MSDIAIKVEHLSKYYKLGTINSGTLRGDLQSWFARKFGKEDPNSKIGSDRFASTEDGFWALKDLNFEIKQGDRVGIIGKNGAGKSTLLKVLSRITAPTEGDVKIRGRVASLLEVGTGFHGELTGRENIYLNGAILGMKRREVTKKLDEIIAFSEIEKYIDTPVKRYSSGMYVRLAFAVAAHLDSEILIADEVLAVGDAAFQKKALGKMNELSTGQGRTVLFVSHNMAAVKNLCNKGIVLEKGNLVRADDNIDDSINWYLNGSINEFANIMNSVVILDSNITVSSFVINKQEILDITLQEPVLEIEICGESNIDFDCEMEIRFFDSSSTPVFTYSPGHMSGDLLHIKKGNFNICKKIHFPKYLSNGIYYGNLSLTHPGVKTFFALEKTMRIHNELVVGKNNMNCPYSNWGYFVFGDE